MKMRKYVVFLVIVLGLFLMTACGKNGGTETTGTKETTVSTETTGTKQTEALTKESESKKTDQTENTTKTEESTSGSEQAETKVPEKTSYIIKSINSKGVNVTRISDGKASTSIVIPFHYSNGKDIYAYKAFYESPFFKYMSRDSYTMRYLVNYTWKGLIGSEDGDFNMPFTFYGSDGGTHVGLAVCEEDIIYDITNLVHPASSDFNSKVPHDYWPMGDELGLFYYDGNDNCFKYFSYTELELSKHEYEWNYQLATDNKSPDEGVVLSTIYLGGGLYPFRRCYSSSEPKVDFEFYGVTYCFNTSSSAFSYATDNPPLDMVLPTSGSPVFLTIIDNRIAAFGPDVSEKNQRTPSAGGKSGWDAQYGFYADEEDSEGQWHVTYLTPESEYEIRALSYCQKQSSKQDNQIFFYAERGSEGKLFTMKWSPGEDVGDIVYIADIEPSLLLGLSGFSIEVIDSKD